MYWYIAVCVCVCVEIHYGALSEIKKNKYINKKQN